MHIPANNFMQDYSIPNFIWETPIGHGKKAVELFNQAWESSSGSLAARGLAHLLISIIQAIPVLGQIVSLVELIAFRISNYFNEILKKIKQKDNPQPSKEEQLQNLIPAEKITSKNFKDIVNKASTIAGTNSDLQEIWTNKLTQNLYGNNPITYYRFCSRDKSISRDIPIKLVDLQSNRLHEHSVAHGETNKNTNQDALIINHYNEKTILSFLDSLECGYLKINEGVDLIQLYKLFDSYECDALMQSCCDEYCKAAGDSFNLWTLDTIKAEEACIALKNETHLNLYKECLSHFLKYAESKNIGDFLSNGHATTKKVIEDCLSAIIKKGDLEYIFDVFNDITINNKLREVCPTDLDDLFKKILKNFSSQLNLLPSWRKSSRYLTTFKAIKHAVNTNNKPLYNDCLRIINKLNDQDFLKEVPQALKKEFIKYAEIQNLLFLRLAIDPELTSFYCFDDDCCNIRLNWMNFAIIQKSLSTIETSIESSMKIYLDVYIPAERTKKQKVQETLISLLSTGSVQYFHNYSTYYKDDITALEKGIQHRKCEISELRIKVLNFNQLNGLLEALKKKATTKILRISFNKKNMEILPSEIEQLVALLEEQKELKIALCTNWVPEGIKITDEAIKNRLIFVRSYL